jgi:cell division protein FtsB
VDQRISFSEQLREFLRRNTSWLLAGGLALLLLQDIFGTHGVLAMRRSQKEAAAIQAEINHLNEENRRLQDRVKALKTDPAEIERIAREEMGLARPGEVIFKIPPKAGDPSATPTESSSSSRKP